MNKANNTIKNYEFALKKFDESIGDPFVYFETLSYSQQKMLLAAFSWRGIEKNIINEYRKHLKKKPYKKTTDTFSYDEIMRIKELAMESDDQTKAIVLVQLEAGVRRDEVQKVFDALERQGMRMNERNVVNISGKGSKYASVFLSKELSNVIANWIYSPNYKRCCKETIGNKTKALLDKIDGSGSCHDLRRAFATNLRNHGVELEKIQVLLRHDNIQTTCEYVKITNDEIFDALSLFYLNVNQFINDGNWKQKLFELQILNERLFNEVERYKELYEREKEINKAFSLKQENEQTQ